MSTAKSSPLPRTEMDALLLGRLDELTVNEPRARGRSLLGVALSVLVLVVLSLLIVLAITLVNPDIGSQFGARRQHAREAISLEEVLTGALQARPFAFTWLRERDQREGADQLLFEDPLGLRLATLGGDLGAGTGADDGATTKADRRAHSNRSSAGSGPASGHPLGQVRTLISSSSPLASLNYEGSKLSPSKRFLLLWTARVQHFRYAQTAKYFLYDTQLDLVTMLSTRWPGGGGGADGAIAPNHYESVDSAGLYLSDQMGHRRAGAGSSGGEWGPPFMGEEFEAPAERFERFQLAEWFVAPSEGDGDSGGGGGRDALLLAQDNDLFVISRPAELGTAHGRGQPARLTHTGQPGVVFNGLPDWLYGEDVLSSGAPAHAISPTGQHLAYLSLNDSRVLESPITWFTSERTITPLVQRLRYPLAGTPNPQVRLRVIENFAEAGAGPGAGARVRDLGVTLPGALAERQHYLYRIRWLAPERLGVLWVNRDQNELQVLVCRPAPPSRPAREPEPEVGGAASWPCERSLTIEEPAGWLEIGDDLHPLDERHYLMLMPRFEGARVGSFKHLARVSLERPDEFEFLTGGARELIRVDAVDSERALVYYHSTLEYEPGQQHLFAVSAGPHAQATERSPDDLRQRSTCLTCHLHPGECLHNDAHLSPSGRHFVLQCNGPGVPRTELRALVHASGAAAPEGEEGSFSPAPPPPPAPSPVGSRLLWTIESNGELRDRLARLKAMPVSVRLSVPIPGTEYAARVLLLLPPLLGPTTSFQRAAQPGRAPADFAWPARSRRDVAPDDGPPDGLEQIRQYVKQMPSGGGGGGGGPGGGFPMIVDVYAGPGQQRVDWRAAPNVGHYFASSRRTVYAMIDGRGSGREGSKRLFEMFGQLGRVEVLDQIRVTRELVRGPLAPLVDPTKVAIWGWSYGGYAAAMALARSNMEAKEAAAAAVAAARQGPHAYNTTRREAPPGGGGANRRGVFECAASVAPTTNFIYYDTAYSERYLRSPWKSELYDLHQPGDHLARARVSSNQSEPDGKRTPSDDDLNERYRSSNLLEYIEHIDRKRFLLMHGTADDNVHVQNSFRLMRQMIKKGILFETRLYPDQRHAVADPANQMHLYNTLSNFFSECFDMAY